MSTIGNYLRDKLLNEAIGAVAFAPAATLEIRLFSTVLTAAGVGTEIANTGYARKTINNDTTNFPNSSTGSKTNAVRIDFDDATEDWDDILAVGLFDSANNLYFFKNLDAPVSIANTFHLYFDIGDLNFSLSS
jgi:hypothetical protein